MPNRRHATPISTDNSRNLFAESRKYYSALNSVHKTAAVAAVLLLILGANQSIQSRESEQSPRTTTAIEMKIGATSNLASTNIHKEAQERSNTVSGRDEITLAIGKSYPISDQHATATPSRQHQQSLKNTQIAKISNRTDVHETSPAQKTVTVKLPTIKAKQQSGAIQKQVNTRTLTETIKPGDNLSKVFQRVGLSDSDVYRVVKSGKEGKALTKMFPGETLHFLLDQNRQLEKVTRQKSKLETIQFIRVDGDSKAQFVVKRTVRSPEIRQVHRSGKISSSLSLAADRAELSPSMTINVANIFGGVIDFVLDVRKGDQFTVIYEEHYLDGEKVNDGKILAAQYVNRGKIYNAYRYKDTEGDIGYYNEDGVSMRKAFLRAPLDFTRISSGFNLRRLHPVTKQVKPHRGIDYAAPRGTPVYSAGEGRVVAAARNRANGNYVFVKHGETYTTKYLHLNKRNVKKGQRVKQGQVIGEVGCTGLCTGPHLHYEFLVNGVHRNPRTIVKKLPKAKRLGSKHKPHFIASIQPIQMQLANYSSQLQLATRE